MLRYHHDVWDPIRVTHLGQRSFDRTTQAEHMIAIDQTPSQLLPPRKTGAVHIWVPAFAGKATKSMRQFPFFHSLESGNPGAATSFVVGV